MGSYIHRASVFGSPMKKIVDCGTSSRPKISKKKSKTEKLYGVKPKNKYSV